VLCCSSHGRNASSLATACAWRILRKWGGAAPLFIRTIGIVRAEAKITLANLAYNIDRMIFHERRAAVG